MKHLTDDELIQVKGGAIIATRLFKFVKVFVKSFLRNIKFLAN